MYARCIAARGTHAGGDHKIQNGALVCVRVLLRYLARFIPLSPLFGPLCPAFSHDDVDT